MKLNPDKQIAITDEYIAGVLNLYGIKDFSYEELRDGLENTSLLIKTGDKKYVLRTYRQDAKSDEDIKLEIGFINYLSQEKIPVQKIVPNFFDEELTFFDWEGKRWHIVLFEFIEGETVSRHYDEGLVCQLAPIHAKMHLLGIAFSKGREKNKWTRILDGYAERINATTLDKDVKSFIDRVKKFVFYVDPVLPHGYNHLDLDSDGNIVTENGKIKGIIDFGDLEYSPCVVCLGYTMLEIFYDASEELMQLYLREYEKVRKLSREEKEALPNVMLFRNYVLPILDLVSGKAMEKRHIEFEAKIKDIIEKGV